MCIPYRKWYMYMQIGQYLRLNPWEATTTNVATKVSFVTAEDMATVNRTMVEYVSHLLHR